MAEQDGFRDTERRCRERQYNNRLTRRSILGALLIMPIMDHDTFSAPVRQVVELHIATDGDDLAFKPKHLSCATGADVRLFFHHTGEILDDIHNWVLLKPDAKKAFLHDADREPDETVIVPKGDEYMVVAATPLCGRGQTVMVEFIAPAPGEYPFVCSVPGHGEVMQGLLTVTA
jgi:azurin